MPTVSRVVMPSSVNGGSTASFLSDDPLADALPVTSLQYRHKKVLLYGPSGAGKTTLAACFPKPLIVVSYEPQDNGGTQSIRKVPGVTFKRVTSKAQAMAIAARLVVDNRSCWHYRDNKWLAHLQVSTDDGKTWRELFALSTPENARVRPMNDGLPYLTHVHDSGTSLEDIVLKDLMGWDEMPVMLKYDKRNKADRQSGIAAQTGTVPLDKYRERSEEARLVLRKFRELHADVVILAKEKDFNREEGEMGRKMIPGMEEAPKGFWSAALGKTTTEWLQDGCDYVMRLSPAREVVWETPPPIEIAGEIQQGPPQQRETGRIVRRLRCTLSDTFAARFRSPDPECVAEYVTGTPQELYDDFIRMCNGEKAKNGYYPK